MPTVEVWSARTDGPARASAQLWSLLEAGEQARAQRFHRREDQQTFVFARGLLRLLLGDRLRLSPAAVRFATGPQGKPYVPGSEWQFNLSHSGEWILCGLTQAIPVGVDVERVRELEDAQAIATRYFSPAEQAQLAACAPEERAVTFFRIWTLKEAYLKATGLGLSFPLTAFDVQVDPPRVVRIDGLALTPQEFGSARLALAAGYEAAVMAQTPEFAVRHQRWHW